MRVIGRCLVRALLLAAFVFVFQIFANAQNTITGQVLGANNRPVSDVYVVLYNELNRLIMQTRTDAAGRYTLRGMGTGRFIVRVRPFGTDYDEESQEVQIANLSLATNVPSADNQEAIFHLKVREDLATRPGVKGVVFAQEVPKEAQDAYEKAVADFAANRPDVGKADLEKALTIFPDYFLANDRMGVEMIRREKWTEARNYFNRAVAVNARSVNSWYGLSYASYALDMTSEAIEGAKKAAELQPDSPDMALMLGIALRKGKQYKDAEAAMLKAKKLADGKSADVAWNLALLYAYNLNKKELAADELENYLKIKPNHPDAEKLRRLIRQYRNQG